MTPQPRHSEKQSTASVFSNSLQRPFAPTRSSGLVENLISRDLADSSPHLSGSKFNTSTSRAESCGPPGSPSSQHSFSFYDNKVAFSAKRPPIEMKEDNGIDRNKQSSQNFPADYRQSSLNTKENIGSEFSIGLLENVMMGEDLLSKMTSDYRQAKIELARLREQNSELESQLTIKTKLVADISRQNTELSRQTSDISHQNSELSRRIAQLKSTTKEAVDKANRSCIELRDAYETLRIQYQASSTLVNDAQKTMESLQELRDAARTGLQVFIDDAGNLPQIGETKAVVNELQAELSRTQQVADLLRDKLQNMGSELLDARSRVTELEEHFGDDRKLITSATLELQRTSERVADVVEYLKLQKNEVIDALSKLAQSEDRLAHSQSRIQERDTIIHSTRQEMEAMRQEISEFEEAMNDRKAQIRILQNTISFQEQHMKNLEERLQKAETEAALAHDRTHVLEVRLEASNDLEKTLVQQNTRLTSEGESIREKVQIAEARLTDIQNEGMTLSAQSAGLALERDMLLDKLKVADAQIRDAKQEEESYRERSFEHSSHIQMLTTTIRFTEARTSLKVLQERFDDQSVTLRLTKDSVNEAQDRLQSVNNTILTLTESLAESNHRASVLEERERSLQLRLDEANVTITTEQNLVGSLRKELLECQITISRQEGCQRATEQVAEKCARDTEQQIRELDSKTSSLRSELDEKQQVISELTRRLAIAETPSDQHEQELIVMKARVDELEQSEKQLIQRATNITVRHEHGDLNDNECMLVQSLAQKAREAFERELVEKNNDIRRRDNLIKQHEARVTQLEASLARRIREAPQVGSSRDDKQDETFWNEPPSGHGKQSSGIHEATKHLVVTDSRYANRTFQTPANDDSDTGEPEDEKDHATRHVKRTISIEDGESARPARRPKNSKHPDMEKITDKVCVSSHHGHHTPSRLQIPGPSKKTNKRQNR
ncbi:hypothetical protein K503DRAFT_802634 [Rhizopogon vinicolor AM-OR11-026]|uniref:Uncharacterized protein n=1 Tax=Rhizopogon vinicolor AM-OR11-026 TaxID=1314800 RepID=A0A1B7MSV6_9AGAM|nr:hypothetical protein K503DRAFT_802634 [Rhizopogon vinicolor AM-OR11-026]